MTTTEKLSDTPRTDAELTKTEGDFYYEDWVGGDFAGMLELELNAAHADGAKLSEALREVTEELNVAKRKIRELHQLWR